MGLTDYGNATGAELHESVMHRSKKAQSGAGVGLTLKAEGIAAERGGRPVLAGIGFSLEAGTALSVTGPNGAGKSTLLRVIAGLLPPAAGRITLDPPDAGDPEKPVAERAHYLGHADALKGALTLREMLECAAALSGGADEGLDPAAALRRVALAHAEDLPCAYLSAGQRRRAALARLLVAPRPLWLLDEPTTALDAASQVRLTAIMADHLAGGGLIVAATHARLDLPGTRTLTLGAAA